VEHELRANGGERLVDGFVIADGDLVQRGARS